MLFAAAGLVLLAACANVANLLLARVTLRMREIVTRTALGARPSRLVRQFLTESLLLSIAAALVGLVAAEVIVRLLVSFGSTHLPRAHEIGLDWVVFAFAVGVAVVTAMAFGVLPAVAAARAGGIGVIKEGTHLTPGRRFARVRDALVVVEVAVACALALGAALVVREAGRLEREPMGMTTDRVLTMHLTPRLTAPEYAAIVARVSQVPGVRAAAMIQLLPLRHWGWEGAYTVRGRTETGRMTAELRYVTPGYFETLEIPVLRGRTFTAGDTADAPPVIVVNQALVARDFRGENPVGVETDRGVIAGVVGDVRQVGLARPAAPEIYFPIAQNLAVLGDAGMSLVVRAADAPARLADAVRSAVRATSPTVAVFDVRTMEEVRQASLAELHLSRWLIGWFATLAVALAVIGMAGVISFHVSSRMREYALRVALGAAPMALARLVFGRALRLAVVGLAAGGALAWLTTPLARALPGASGAAGEPGLHILVFAVMAGLALAACALPAVRAARVDPLAALRQD
jgi:predicted permease